MAAKRPQESQKIASPRRGDIYLLNFDPTLGSEIQKTRAALVIQNDISNRHSPITIVAAMTTKYGDPPYPTEVAMLPDESGLSRDSAALLNQIRAVDRQRLVKRIGRADERTMRRVDRAIEISLGLVRF